jgi:uncharacterized protein YaiI (UPF0178 family)
LKIWVDADAAPRDVKDILFRASERRRVPVVLVANRPVRTPRNNLVTSVVVGAGFDVADDYIVDHCEAGDLVISSDIPLAAAAVEKGATVLKFRGELLTEANVRQRLAMRDFMDEMRQSGTLGGGPPPFGKQDKQRFGNSLDRLLTAGGF